MSNITPIETSYKGHRFRSRLEARWAVFFETLRIPWLYEPEGFHFNGHMYLPDFFLPTLNHRSMSGDGTYAEIKPGNVDKSYSQMLSDFTESSGKTLILLASGTVEHSPSWHNGGDFHYEYTPCGGWDNCMLFAKCYRCGKIKIEFSEGNYMQCEECCGKKDKWCSADDNHPDLLAAVVAAKSARFEHGETPR